MAIVLDREPCLLGDAHRGPERDIRNCELVAGDITMLRERAIEHFADPLEHLSAPVDFRLHRFAAIEERFDDAFEREDGASRIPMRAFPIEPLRRLEPRLRILWQKTRLRLQRREIFD